MKKSFFLVSALLLLSGCFETKFNFRTVIHPNGRTDREVQIDGRGANRFLAPAGPNWEIKTFETKGGQSILEDRHFHIHAQGRFKHPSEITSDFRYDVARLIDNVTEETRREFKEELGIPEPLEDEIVAANRIQFEKKPGWLTVEYRYAETFQNRWIVPILMHDLKKEIRRRELAKIQTSSVSAMPAAAAVATGVPSQLLSEEKVEALAHEQLTKEILPQFQFHSEIVMPGKIVNTNAKHIHGRIAVWDWRGNDFEKNYSTYTLEVVSRAVNSVFVGILVFLVLLAGIVTFSFRRRKLESAGARRRRSS